MGQHLLVTLRLQLRNPMALVYSYLFPAIFLVAFWVLYRHEAVPLIRHMGELLTVTALGGACFGLPTALVSERERGVWRRYRVMPIAMPALVASTVAARYLLLLTAAVWQIGLAVAVGMPAPPAVFQLFLAFTLVAFAFIGLGLIIAMLADTVPAVQALGQCIFLPMLIIGGVAVRIESLPAWAQHLSAFFPGRYAVQTIQDTFTGDGLSGAVFSVFALVAIGVAGAASAMAMFRWEAEQRFVATGRKAWLGLALGAWAIVGVAAEATGVVSRSSVELVTMPRALDVPAVPAATTSQPVSQVSGQEAETGQQVARPSAPLPAAPPAAPAAPLSRVSPPRAATVTPPSAPAQPVPPPVVAATPPAVEPAVERTWRDVTMADIELNIVFAGLPPDEGVVSPIANTYRPYGEVGCIQQSLPKWAPASVADLEQRARNLLYVAAVPDVIQMEIEWEVPLVVFRQLRQSVGDDDLIKILYWIATHPETTDVGALDQLSDACLEVNAPADLEQVFDRVRLYATKFLGRMLGKLP